MHDKSLVIEVDENRSRFEVDRHSDHRPTNKKEDDFQPGERTIYLYPHRWKLGLFKLLQALASGGVGGYLLSQIRYTPNLSVQMAVIGTVGLLIAGVLLNHAARDLLGKIVIDDRGISLSYAFYQSDIRWNHLQYWKMTGSFTLPLSYDKFIMTSSYGTEPMVIPLNWLNETDRIWLFDVLTNMMQKGR